MIIQTPAIILRRFPYGDTSIIAHVFARETGKVSVIVKGARRKGSIMAACFQPLSYLDIIYYHKDTRDIQTISKADFIQTWSRFSEDLNAVSMALALLEITDKTMVNYDPHPELFDSLVAVISAFDIGLVPKNILYWHYQLRVLTIMGFKPDILNKELPDYGIIANKINSQHILSLLLNTDLSDIPEIKISAAEKKTISNYIYDQFRRHFEGMNELKSMKVLRQLVV